MITDIKQVSIKQKLERHKLKPYWLEYFDCESDINLYELTKNELKQVVELERKRAKPFIDSQQVISKLLTILGSKHKFHRQFRENHENSDSGQVLGMQLYHIMLEDIDV